VEKGKRQFKISTELAEEGEKCKHIFLRGKKVAFIIFTIFEKSTRALGFSVYLILRPLASSSTET